VLVRDGLLVALRDEFSPGLHLVDVSDPAAPATLATIGGNHYNGGLLQGPSLQVTTETFLLTYDLTDPASPLVTGAMPLGDRAAPRHLTSAGGAFYLFNDHATLRVLDVDDPLHPVDLGLLASGADRVDAMAGSGDFLHALHATSGGLDLVTWDVTAPMAPVETARFRLSIDPAATGAHVVIEGDLLLAGADDGTLRAFDLGDPAHPAPGFELGLRADHIAVSQNRLLVLAGKSLSVFPRTDALTPPGAPVVRSLLPRLRDIDGANGFTVGQLHDDRSVLMSVDTANPLHPMPLGQIDTGVDGKFVLDHSPGSGLAATVSLDGKFRLVDFADPAEPTLRGGYDNSRVYFFSAVFGPGVLAIETSAVVVETRFYDITDPDHPVMRGLIYDYGPQDIDGGVLLTAAGEEIRLYDITDLAHPQYLRRLELPGAVLKACIHEGYVYALTVDITDQRAIQVVRLADPTGPQWVASIDVDHNAVRLESHGTRLYAYGYSTCDIYDIAYPEAISRDASFPAWGSTGTGLVFNGALTTIGGWLITLRDEGFSHVAAPEAPPAAACRLLPAAPNPFNPATTVAFTVDRTRELTVSVHDARGRRVAELARGVFPPGRHEATWRGLDDDGRPVASGVYLVRLHGAGVESGRTVTLVK
jgi:hypothetical protein